jgi:hypothetical protein
MIAKIKDFVKAHFNDILIFVIVALLVLLSFAIGYITANYMAKTPIIIEKSK